MRSFIFLLFILAGLSILIVPFFPSVTFDFREEKFGHTLEQQVEKRFVSPIPAPPQKIIQEFSFASPVIMASFNNRLFIPRINVDVPLVEGSNWKEMNSGAWRLPNSATPDQEEGNMVVSGHRFAFWGRNNKIFYYLDKLKTGDEIEITWQGKKYYYVVKGSKVIWPHEEEVLEQTRDKKLTLITCTPIGTANQRLIVEALPVDVTLRASLIR